MTTDPLSEIRSLALGVRVVVVGFTLIISVFNLRLSLLIGYYRELFREALPGQILPVLTNLVLNDQTLWTTAAIVLPTIAVLIAVIIRNNGKALIGLTICMILICAQAGLTMTALLSPLTDLMDGMSQVK